ncbi:gamma carbonic anhydrase family protein [Amycolatopsis thermophila]|uniref:Carbonic anhydrase/acetyltransferase-like protein (Isoleucine patch superfamily) n=1 Tax=Amycolatopsis thermophila TaxID=206084 RepID=A0ABU0F0T6_9PSEU|nr:gamma carbonic anhydrase family protein [Amycolatopsis thermophila]MDQ0381116.1 carbonic anhydrase/acetyltransferase-like protein (isoleucine patch superfamily) [Amycolatopsis thermophila]
MTDHITVDGKQPVVDPAAWIAPGAVVAGAVTVGAGASVWYTAVLRGDMDTITVGEGTNIQDGTIVHADPGFPATIGAGVSVGHRAVLHGCTVEDDCLIGMGAVVLNGAKIGAGSLVAAGAVVLEGTEIPPGSLVAGLPAKVRRPLTPDEQAATRANAANYRALARTHARG